MTTPCVTCGESRCDDDVVVARRATGDTKAIPKVLFCRLGAHCSRRLVYNLNGMFNYLHTGWWLRAHGFEPRIRVRSREDVWSRAADEVGHRQVLYLEFGVAKGASITRWAELLTNPTSSLHGFDSFLGLPHDWSLEGHPQGYFSTGGRPPRVDDPRIEFFPGWFEETLPAYQWPEHETLVVMMDADLYSSTAFVLEQLKSRLAPRSFLYFDQFHHRCDELRAFAELLEDPSMRFELAVASRDMSSLAFRRI
jgi:Macrocin-O-methyltransferase (TylF)